jgi:hypothetical protein
MNQVNNIIRLYISKNVTLTADMLRLFALRIEVAEAKTPEESVIALEKWTSDPMSVVMHELEVSWALS